MYVNAFKLNYRNRFREDGIIASFDIFGQYSVAYLLRPRLLLLVPYAAYYMSLALQSPTADWSLPARA